MATAFLQTWVPFHPSISLPGFSYLGRLHFLLIVSYRLSTFLAVGKR